MLKKWRTLIGLGIYCLTCTLASITSVVFAYITMSYPDVPLPVAQQLLSMANLVGLVVAFAIGPIAIKVSKKVLLVFSACCMLAYTMIFLFIGGRGPIELLIVAAGLVGVSNGSNMTLIGSVLAENYEPSKNATYISILTGVMGGLSLLFNMLAGVIAAGDNGAMWPWAYVLGLACIPAIICMIILLPGKGKSAQAIATQTDADARTEAEAAIDKATTEAMPPSANKKERISGRVLLMALTQLLWVLLGMAFMYNASSYIITDFQLGTSVEAGFAISLYGVSGLVINFSYPVWSRIFKRFIAPVGYAIAACSVVIMALVTTTVFSAYAAAVLLGVGIQLANPYVFAKIMEETPPRLVSVGMSLAMGLTNSAGFLAVFVLAFVGGLLGGGIIGTLFAGAIFGALTVVLALFLFVFAKKKSVKEAL